MNKWSLYASTLVGIYLLYELSGQFYGSEWLFALLTIGLFALFLRGWKRSGANGVALAFITAFTLLTINSIFYLLAPPIFAVIATIVLGLTLIPLYSSHQDSILTAWVLIIINCLLHFELGNEITFALSFLLIGVAALVGYLFQLLLLKNSFTIIFFLIAFLALMINIFSGAYMFSLFVALLVVMFAVLAYRFSIRNV